MVAKEAKIGESYKNEDIRIVELGLSSRSPINAIGSYQSSDSAPNLNSQDLLAIGQRRNLLTVAYLMGDEGASISQCLYSIYYLLWGVVNDRPDIITLLKNLKFSFACVMNPDRLEDLEDDRDGNGANKLIYRPKNANKSGPHNCPSILEGVNLKYNYLPVFANGLPGKFTNPCSLQYGGVPGQQEDETRTLVTYINQQGTAGVSMFIISK